MVDILFKEEAYQIIGACFEVHNEKGSGFVEPVYQECLETELVADGYSSSWSKTTKTDRVAAHDESGPPMDWGASCNSVMTGQTSRDAYKLA